MHCPFCHISPTMYKVMIWSLLLILAGSSVDCVAQVRSPLQVQLIWIILQFASSHRPDLAVQTIHVEIMRFSIVLALHLWTDWANDSVFARLGCGFWVCGFFSIALCLLRCLLIEWWSQADRGGRVFLRGFNRDVTVMCSNYCATLINPVGTRAWNPGKQLIKKM